MTDRELLEQINNRLNTLESQLGKFIANTEANFTRVFDEFNLVYKRIENLDGRLDLEIQELVGV